MSLGLRGMVAALIAAAIGQATIAADPPVVRVAEGSVLGEVRDGARVFRGIPYAAPPVGGLRWRPPAPAVPWRGARRATAFAANCPSTRPAAPAPNAPAPDMEDEDCLYLNVWAPRDASRRAPRPVMVWIVGGGFQRADVARPIFDGAALARQGVVLVTVGYRVGVLGYLALPALAAESPHQSAGNYGLLDAVAALRWVRRNIAAFGGDPARVTIFGQSSGSETVNILTASPLARGLFARAIQQSGASFGEREAKPLPVAMAAGETWAARVGGGDLARLRALPLPALLAAATPPFEPNVDGWLLRATCMRSTPAGRQTRVPMLIGSNADEAQLDPALDLAGLGAKYRRLFGSAADTLLARFPAIDDATARATDKRLGTLLLGDYNAATTARLAAAAGVPVYRYRFEHVPPPARPGPSRGAYHGAEIPYVFRTLDRDARPWTPGDRMLAATISRYWINFATTGDPNGPGLPAWPRLANGREQLMRFDDVPRVASWPFGDDVDLAERFFYGPGGLYTRPAPR